MGKYHTILDDGRILYSASSIGYCPAAMFWDRIGITGEPTPEWMQERYDAGHENEPVIEELLERQKVWQFIPKEEWLEMGYQPGGFNEERNQDYTDQIRVEFSIGTNLLVAAHLDGLVRMINVPPGWDKDRLGEVRIAEKKAFGPSYWGDWQSKGIAAFPKYQWQISAQMKGAGLPLLFVVGRKATEGTDTRCVEVDSRSIDTPPIGIGTMIKKLLDVEKRVAEREQGIEVVPECHKPLDYPCPFYPFHEEKEISQPEDATTIALIDSLAEQYEKWRVAKDEADKKEEGSGKRVRGTV